MTTEQQRAKEQAAVMLAFAEGKKIECRQKYPDRGKWLCFGNAEYPLWNWEEYNYRIAPDQEPQLPPIPDGYELVPIDSEERAKAGWLACSPKIGDTSWDKKTVDNDFPCSDKWCKDYSFRYCRPIRKPKMPDGIFVVRFGCNVHTVAKYDEDGNITFTTDPREYSPKMLCDVGASYSYDRKTWFNFYGEEVK